MAIDRPAYTLGPSPRERDTWYYPPEIAGDLEDVDLPEDVKAETFACAWEYARSVIPHYTSWERYIAFMRIIIIGTICEFNGRTVDVMASDNLLGHSLSGLFDTLFQGIHNREDMEREYRSFLLFTAHKASDRRDGELFRRYANSLANSPRQWFRMRDCDGLARFTMMAALACNDVLDVCFTEPQFETLAEISITMYDAVAFYKHRSEGEVNSTFAYMPDNMRIKAFRQCREVLWALDAAMAHQRGFLIVANFLRMFGGAIHMLMRRYRFIEENLTIGVPETEGVVSLARANFKLWYRIDANKIKDVSEESIQCYKDVLARSDELLFPGLADVLEMSGDGDCDTCLYRASYGAEASHRFGGVQLCDSCRVKWRGYLESFPDRAAKAFPVLVDMYRKGIASNNSFRLCSALERLKSRVWEGERLENAAVLARALFISLLAWVTTELDMFYEGSLLFRPKQAAYTAKYEHK
ncbi:hypothetical protein B0H19DRAFT_1288899 [Mycena capillaripes]|nr:hypothetical protein B0H19DRAFT_1288899 [Mycena capillaripes]